MSENVRSRILDAGVDLLHAQGLAALTQPRIAQAAGCRQSHLTYYFPTRDALLLAIAEHSVDRALAAAVDAGEGDDLRGRLRATLGFLPRVRMLMGLVSAADADPALRATVARLIEHVRTGLARLLAHHGLALDDAQVRLFHAAMVGFAVLNLGRQSADSAADIAEGLDTLLGLLPAAREKP